MNRHKVAALSLIISCTAHALDKFECVRDLMPVTEAAAFQVKRVGFEKPFMVTEHYMAFPSVDKDAVTGFFIYTKDHAYHYDSVQNADGSLTPIADLKRTNAHTLFELVAQPNGLETVTLKYMPGFDAKQTTKGGPVALGSTVLPVVGSFMSRPKETLNVVYRNPSEVDAETLQQWVYDHSSRRPATSKDIELDRQILHMAVKNELKEGALWAPLNDELKLRQNWIQNHNLTEAAFKEFSRVKETSCK